MNPSPMQLERHFFTKVHVDAHRDGDESVKGVLSAEVELARAENNPRRFQVTLRLKLLPAADTKPRYTGEIHVIGLVSVAAKWPKDRVLPLVEANGPALLYGAAREMLCNVTARGPWPMHCLHSVSFVNAKSTPKSPEEKKAALSTKTT
jgi:preprotein translocase subunit SecB